MGVLTDYFRAPDRATVIRMMQADSTSPIVHDEPLDGIEVKAVDPVVVLGQLVASIAGIEWEVDLVGEELIYTPTDDRSEPPWVTEIDRKTRDTLASLEDERIPEVAAVWATAEEFYGSMTPGVAAEIITELRDLARRAIDHDELLYCWACL